MLRDTKASTCSTTTTNQVQFFQLNADTMKDHLHSKDNFNLKKTNQNQTKQKPLEDHCMFQGLFVLRVFPCLPSTNNYYRSAICNCPNPSS